MVHKKFTYKNGRRYGPYYYENKRVGNKIITTYLGSEHPCGERRRTGPIEAVFILFGILFLFVVGFMVFSGHDSGISLSPGEQFSISLSKSNYQAGESIAGNINMGLLDGELVPADSKVIAKLGSSEKELGLSELLDIEPVSGQLYLSSVGVLGSGNGYGVEGERLSHPNIDFKLRLYKEEGGDPGSAGSDVVPEKPTEVIPVTPGNNIPEENTDNPDVTAQPDGQSQPASENVEPSSQQDVPASDTGTAASEAVDPGVNGADASEPSKSVDSSSPVSSDSSSTSSDSSGGEPSLSPAEDIIDGSVNSEAEFSSDIPEGWSAEIVDGSVMVDGEEVSDSLLNLDVKGGKVIVSTEYSISEKGFGEGYLGDSGNELSIDISKFGLIAGDVSENIEFRVEYEGKILFDSSDEVVVGDQTDIVPEDVPVDIPIEVSVSQIVVGEPVVWEKDVSGSGEVLVELPISAEVLGVEKVQSSGNNVQGNPGEAVQVDENVKRGNDADKILSDSTQLEKVDVPADVSLSPSDVQMFSVALSEGEVAKITYTTPAVEAERKYEDDRMIVTYTAPDIDGHPYENVLASELVPPQYMDKLDSIRVKWDNEERAVSYNIAERDGGVYVEFDIPHFSVQTFEIIFATKAEHLDENRSFVDDVYDYIKERDGNWTNVPEGHYLRVTFEKELDSSKDITIYAKSNGSAKIEVYQMNGDEKIAEFENVSAEAERKVYLTNLSGPGDTFDLFVEGADVEFDHVVDPVGVAPEIDFTPDTTSGVLLGDSIYAGLNTFDETYHYSFIDMNNDVLLWMTMDKDNNSIIHDYSSYSHDGTPSGVTFTSSNWANASVFGGSSRIVVPELDNAAYIDDGSMTISLRVKSSYANVDLVSDWGTTGGDGGGFELPGLVSSWGWDLYIDSNGKLAFQGGGGGQQFLTFPLVSSNTVTGNQWKHVVVVEDREAGRTLLYIDGYLSANGTGRSRAKDPSRDFMIGQQSSNPFSSTVYQMNDVIVFKRALSQEEVRSLQYMYSSPPYSSATNPYSRNFTGLSPGEYTFTGYTINSYGDMNQTEARTVSLLEDVQCGELNEAGRVYTLYSDLSSIGTCINITADNIVLDGNGHAITGSLAADSFGILVDNAKNITIKNVSVSSYDIGVLLEYTNDSLIENVTSYSNTHGGAEVDDYSSNNIVRNNVFRNTLSGHGFSLYNHPSDNIVENNSIYGNSNYGIYLGVNPVRNVLVNNRIYSNTGAEINTDSSDTENILVYNNSYGQIVWKMNHLRASGDLTFPGNVNISQNFVSLNTPAFDLTNFPELGQYANVTLYGGPASSFYNPQIFRNDSVPCNAVSVPSCIPSTSLNAQTVEFSVSAWSNYSIKEVSQPVSACRDLNESGYYLLTADIGPVASTCFNITADDVILNGNGHTITGPSTSIWPGPVGVLVGPAENVKLLDLVVSNFSDGIRMNGTNGSSIANSVLKGSYVFGVYILNGNQNIVNSSRAINNGQGFGSSGGGKNIFYNSSAELGAIGYHISLSSTQNAINSSSVTLSTQKGIVVDGAGTDNNIVDNVTFNLGNNALYLDISAGNGTLVKDSYVKNYSISGSTLRVQDSRFGEVQFLQPLTATGTNLSNDIKLGYSKAEVDSFSKPGLDKGANVSLYNLPGAARAEILRNGNQSCNSTTVPACYNFTSLSAQNVLFNVSSWTYYTVSDTIPVTNCSVLDVPNKKYVLQNDILIPQGGPTPCINITADNVLFDGNNHMIQKQSFVTGTGVYSLGTENVSVQNLSVSRFTYGISLESVTNLYMSRVTSSSNSYGLWLSNVNEFSVLSSIFSSNAQGAYIYNCAYGNMTNNAIQLSSSYGAYFRSLDYSSISNNNIVGTSTSPYGLWFLFGTNNIVAGNTIQGNLGSSDGFGILLDNPDYNQIINNSIMGNRVGIRLTNDVRNNVLLNNNISGNIDYQIYDTSSAGYNTYLVYNNSYGEITWTNSSPPGFPYIGFLDQMVVRGNLTFPGTIKIESNLASLDSNIFAGEPINSSANITLYGLAQYGFTNPAVFMNGALCPPEVCQNYTSLELDTVKLNVTHWTNYSIQNYSNHVPTVVLTNPEDNITTFDRTPQFEWNGFDNDNDNLTFDLKITCYPACPYFDNHQYTGLPPQNNAVKYGTYLPIEELKNFFDITGSYYNWTVRAFDGTEYGPWAQERRINIQSLLDVNLSTRTVNFGTLGPGQVESTSDNNPPPMNFTNLGNVKVNTTINATDLWLTQHNPSEYYKYGVKYGSLGGLPSFRQVPNLTSPEDAILNLNHSQQRSNYALVHYLISVPSGEPPGLRNSTVIFVARRAE